MSSPLPGRYEQRGLVRFCRLSPSQWEAIRGIRPGQVPGLGGLWTTLTRQHLVAPVAHHPSDLIPVLMFRERYRRSWRDDPYLYALMADNTALRLAEVHVVDRYSTSSGGEYMICRFRDLLQEVDAVLLLWVELQMTLVYEPYEPPMPPRVARLQIAGLSWHQPPWLSRGGGGPLEPLEFSKPACAIWGRCRGNSTEGKSA